VAHQSGDILKITPVFKYNFQTDRFVNVWHVLLDLATPKTDPEMAALIGTWLELVYLEHRLVVSTNYQYVEYDWENITQGLLYPAELWPTFVNGAGAGDVLSSMLCGYVFARTYFSRVYGRKYFNGFSEGRNSAYGEADTTALTALTLIAAAGYGDTVVTPGNVFKGVINTTLHGYVEPPTVVARSAWRALQKRRLGIGT